MRKQFALLAVAIGAASLKQEAEAKRLINSNKARVEEEKRKEVEGKKIKKMKRQEEERKKQEKEALKEEEKIAAKAQALKNWQRKAAEGCKAEVASLTKVNEDCLFAEDLIKLREKLKEAMGMKKKIEEESKREVENRVGDKKQVVNRKILMTVRIVVAHMNSIDGSVKAQVSDLRYNSGNLYPTVS